MTRAPGYCYWIFVDPLNADLTQFSRYDKTNPLTDTTFEVIPDILNSIKNSYVAKNRVSMGLEIISLLTRQHAWMDPSLWCPESAVVDARAWEAATELAEEITVEPIQFFGPDELKNEDEYNPEVAKKMAENHYINATTFRGNTNGTPMMIRNECIYGPDESIMNKHFVKTDANGNPLTDKEAERQDPMVQQLLKVLKSGELLPMSNPMFLCVVMENNLKSCTTDTAWLNETQSLRKRIEQDQHPLHGPGK